VRWSGNSAFENGLSWYPSRQKLLARREESDQPYREIRTHQARYRLIPTRTGSGTVDPTSQGWPTGVSVLARGARIRCWRELNNRPWQNQDASASQDAAVSAVQQSTINIMRRLRELREHPRGYVEEAQSAFVSNAI
jgi:hypothetical protein